MPLFIKISDKISGPLAADALRRLVAAGRLKRDHLVGKSATGPWVAAGNVKGLVFPTLTRNPCDAPAEGTAITSPALPAPTEKSSSTGTSIIAKVGNAIQALDAAWAKPRGKKTLLVEWKWLEDHPILRLAVTLALLVVPLTLIAVGITLDWSKATQPEYATPSEAFRAFVSDTLHRCRYATKLVPIGIEHDATRVSKTDSLDFPFVGTTTMNVRGFILGGHECEAEITVTCESRDGWGWRFIEAAYAITKVVIDERAVAEGGDKAREAVEKASLVKTLAVAEEQVFDRESDLITKLEYVDNLHFKVIYPNYPAGFELTEEVAWQILDRSFGPIRVAEITEPVAAILGQGERGLSLELETITPAVARQLARNKGPIELLSRAQKAEFLTPDVAKEFAAFGGRSLCFWDVEALPEDVARALQKPMTWEQWLLHRLVGATQTRLELPEVRELSVEAAAALNDCRHEVVLSGLERMTTDLAKRLAARKAGKTEIRARASWGEEVRAILRAGRNIDLRE